MTTIAFRILRTAVGTIVLTLCAVVSVCAQRQGDVWYFADYLGLDFSEGSPALITDGQISGQGSPTHSEASSTICNSDGNLLFYTNGERIWDREHQLMPNGDSLLGHYSSTQGALIVPQPGSSNIFYVFTTDGFYESGLKNGFRYSIVDMCLNEGKGAVVEGQKNILLLDTVAEKLTAVLHANGIDYWIIVHKYYSDSFYSFRLSQSGIAETVVSEVGSTHPHPLAFQGTGSAIGQMKASPDGSRLALVSSNGGHGIAELFDFDRSVGKVSNCISLQSDDNNHQCYGVSFSRNNHRLYISCGFNNSGIHQFDLLAGSSAAIRTSKTIVTTAMSKALQLANNGKIYIARYNGYPYIDVIHEPDNLGIACNFEDSAIYLQGRAISFGLPNFIDSYTYTNGLVSCTEEVEPDTLVIPTAFTPDGDGVNDAFEVENLPAGSELVIYSRWGREVYRSESYAGGWDAANVTGGVYYFILTLPDGGMRKGVVHVVK